MATAVRLRAKRDANEKAIVEALEAFGADVLRISGEGLPDLFVHYRGRWVPLEVKSKTGGFTKLQAERMTNGRVIFPVARTVDDALKAVGVSVGA